MKISEIAKLALLVIEFLKKIEEILDPEEKSKLEDVLLNVLGEIAEKLAQED